MKLFFYCILLLLNVCINFVYGASCEEVFPTTIANSDPTGVMTLNYGAQIDNSPGGEVVTNNLVEYWANSCDGSNCTATNTSADLATDFNSFLGGSAVTVPYKNTDNISPGHYSAITLNSESKLNFSPGDYYVSGDVYLNYKAEIKVSGAGTVRLYVGGKFEMGSESELLTSGSPNKYFFIYTRGNFTMQSQADAKAVVFSLGNVNMNSGSSLEGAITSDGDITVQNNSVITYSSSIITNADFGTSCGTGSTATLASFNIDVGGGSGSTCSEFSVSITARDSSDATLTDYLGTIQLSTTNNNGDWTKTGTASDAYGTLTAGSSDSGAASYEFDASDNGTITLNLSNTHSETITVTVEDSSEGVSTESSNITFSDNAFVFSFDEDVVAGRDHSILVSMMRRAPAPTSTDCAVATNYNVSNVKIYLTRDASDPGGAAPYLINQAATSNVQFAESLGAAASFNASFSSGTATLTLDTSDVGKYAINIIDDSGSFADVTISGTSSTLIARPFGFYISASGNPAAADETGSVYTQAGANFSVSVMAVAWQSADDSDANGVPDNHSDSNASNNADLSDNAALPSFGQESAAETINLSSTLRQPSGGNDPGLAGATTLSGASNGSVSGTVSFAEVGIIELAASVSSNDYLGMGATRSAYMTSASGNVGRFIPAEFSLSGASISDACTTGFDFNYLGQQFTLNYTLSALNSSGAVTQNYSGVFAKLSALNLLDDYVAADSAAPTNLSARISPQGGFFTWISGVLTAQATQILERDSSLDGPYESVSIGINPIDTDGVSLASAGLNLDSDNDTTNDAAEIGVTEFRFGRLVQEQAFGPETADLPVNLSVEYWDGIVWRTNTDDSCTELLLSAVSYPDGSIDNSSNRTITVGSGSTVGQYDDIDATDIAFNSGVAGHYFSAPGSGNTGSFEIDIDLSAYDWLQFDWDGDGDYSESAVPSTTITFGAYRGHDRILYWQEVLQ